MGRGGIGNTLAAGVVAVALVTAIGLHSSQLAQLPKPLGSAGSQVLNTAEKG